MIDIPAADIISRITKEKGISEADVRSKIKEKLTQLAGLISEDGAAHIVANELGVELIKTQGEVKINDLFPGMKSVTVPGIARKKWDVRTFDKNGKQGKVASFQYADETGEIRVTLWNDQTDLMNDFQEGDTLRVKNAYVKENRGQKELHLTTDSRLEIKPAGVQITAKPFAASKNQAVERKTIKELEGNEQNVELLATIVQVYDPRFFDVCPECRKRLTNGACQAHGDVAPVTNYVVSAFLDDGTGNIRTTFWKEESQTLLAKSDEEILAFQANPQGFEAVKTDLLGEIIKITGRVKKNETFDRMELTASSVEKEVDPEEELKRINEKSAESIETLDAPAAVKTAMKETLEEPPKVNETVVEETKYEEELETGDLKSDFDEEAISLDDLDDLDEKL